MSVSRRPQSIGTSANGIDQSLRKICNDFRVGGELTDMVLRPGEGEAYDESDFRAHRLILAATIPFLRDKFRFIGGDGQDVDASAKFAPSVFSTRAILGE